MIKVLHFFKTYYPETMGGIEQVIFQLAEGGIKRGIQSEVLYLSRRGSARNELIANHVAHRSKLNFEIASTGFSASAFRDFSELSRAADIVHYHFPWPFMDILHFASSLKKPALVSYHSDIVKQKNLLRLYQPLMHRFLSSMDCIVAASPNYVSTSEVLARYSDKILVIPYGLDKSTYPEPSEEKLDMWRRKFGSRFFLFIGAMRYYKGLGVLIDAVRGNDWPVVIVGSGPLEAELKNQAEKSGLHNIHFLGSLPDDDKTALLSLCYALVFPSHLRSEAFGISLLEGAMYKKPMICCEIGTGTSYININGETGYVVLPNDPDSLKSAMQRLWADPERARKMGDHAENRFRQIFTADKMNDSYADLYRKLIQGKRHGRVLGSAMD